MFGLTQMHADRRRASFRLQHSSFEEFEEAGL